MKRLMISLRAVKRRNRKRTGRPSTPRMTGQGYPVFRVHHCGICGATDHNVRTHGKERKSRTSAPRVTCEGIRIYRCGICGATDHNARTHENAV